MFNAGNISIKGTGSTICNLICINTPFDFRKAFQDVLGSYIPSHTNDGYDRKPDLKFVRKNAEINTNHTSSASITINSGDIVGKSESLIKLKSLLDAGILTQEEFDSEKKKILNS